MNSWEPDLLPRELTSTDVPVRPTVVSTSSREVSPGVFSIEVASG